MIGEAAMLDRLSFTFLFSHSDYCNKFLHPISNDSNDHKTNLYSQSSRFTAYIFSPSLSL